MKTGIELISEERQRQIDKEGWNTEHDNIEHSMGELSIAAACYAINKIDYGAQPNPHVVNYYGEFPDVEIDDAFPFEEAWDKRKKHDRLRSLVIAGALIAAEIDRVQALENESR